jgi:hypothetical protein
MLLEKQLGAIGTANEPPVVDLFVHSLAQTIPPTVKLTGFSMSKADPGYTVRLEGYTLDPEAPFLPFLEQLESALTNSVFRIQITDSTRQRIFGGADQGAFDPHNPALNQGKRQFFINGRFE